MNELVWEHGGQIDFDVFFSTLFGLIYSALPLIIIIAGVGAVVGSIHTEPWGGSWYPPATLLGFILIILGVLMVVNS